ncbi:unnamed protein product [Vitrella brassicaformis CCMP3155]|uniref:Dynein light chain n=2 Tax=Vitrella brassicaformis TaxID=1169539 RepID=A0A0G4ES57_VITBC|nr:unnamed protein product [Vitrella brassicaformis CCMP3155]|eukprot:CEM00880.1 unnamed protein product [Vitrella brassicaformis CCMP3155]
MGARVLYPPDVPDDILEDVIQKAQRLTEEHNPDREGQRIAEAMKHELDQKWGPYWHVIVGRHFGTYVISSTQRFVYFYLGPHAFCVYK